MPNIKILQIGYNLFTELGKSDPSVPIADQKVKGFANLEDLHLEGNLFTDWNQVLRLSHLPKYLQLTALLFLINIVTPWEEKVAKFFFS